MISDTQGFPIVSPGEARGLGVRVPPNENADVEIGEDDYIKLNQKGMSVAPTWRDLPLHRIPRTLKGKHPAAQGSKQYRCFRLGDTEYVDQSLGHGLQLYTDPEHGTICPSELMSVEPFQDKLANTQERWVIDED